MNQTDLVHNGKQLHDRIRAGVLLLESSYFAVATKVRGILLFFLLLVLGLALSHRHTGRPSTSADASNSPPDLDSFSEPSIAAAVLKRHAKALQEACSADLSLLSGANPGAFQNRATEWIARYQEGLDRQEEIVKDGDLEHGLLILYRVCNRRQEFVDCYLKLLGASPNHPVVWRWAGCALEFAQSCGRREEVLDALQHIARFDRDLEVANHVRDGLEKWTAENLSRPPVNLP
jgi:hypothetical protein